MRKKSKSVHGLIYNYGSKRNKTNKKELQGELKKTFTQHAVNRGFQGGGENGLGEMVVESFK